MNKPNLADASPGLAARRHPITGQLIQPLGVRRNGAPIWPAMGGSQPLGDPAAGSVQPQAGQIGGQQPAGTFVPGLGGVPVPVLAPGAFPMAGVPQGVPAPGPAGPVWPGGQPGQVPQYGPAAGAMPAPYAYPAQQPAPFGQFPAPYAYPAQQPAPFGPPVPNGAPVNGSQPAGQQQGSQQGQQGQQQTGQQQPQGGGQQQTGGGDGAWDRPYPQGVALDQMNPDQKVEFWKWHARQHENKLRSMGDYDQIKAQLGQLQQMTQTEWQRAVMDAENRGRASALEQAAGQMVAVAFQGAAQHRMTPDQIQAAIARMDARTFVHNGQVDIASIQAYVDTIAPPRQNGLVPLLPNQPQGQLPLQQVTLGQQPLQPGQPGYAQQPTFGPLGQPQQPYNNGGVLPYGQQPYGQQPYGQQQPALGGQVVPPGYGQVPVPGVPNVYQPAAQMPQPVVQAAGLHGLPGLHGRQPGVPAAADFGQGPSMGLPASAQTAGSSMAAVRHGKTRSQQLAATRGQ